MSDAQDAYMMMYRTLNSGGVTGPSTYPEAVTAIGTPVLWYKFQGTSGTTAANSGSLGSGWDATFSLSHFVLGNTGQIGANEAIKNVNGLNNNISKTGATPTDTLSALTFARLIYYPSAPFIPSITDVWSVANQRAYFFDNSTRAMQFRVDTAVGTSDKTTSTLFPLAQWFWAFGRWDGATGVTDIKWGYSGALNNPALTSDTSAAVGTMDITQFRVQAARANSLIDEYVVWDTVATDEQLLNIVTLSGL